MPEEQKTRWYLSFADDAFLGACIVEASGLVDAVTRAHRLKINPGGQVAGHEVPAHIPVDARWENKLLTKADLQEMFPGEKIQSARDRELEKRIHELPAVEPLERVELTLQTPLFEACFYECGGNMHDPDSHAEGCPKKGVRYFPW